MKTRIQNMLVALALLALANLNSHLSTALAQTTAFTYQGQLTIGVGNANGSYDLRFALYDANIAGNPIAGPITNAATAVSNGLFTVTLDFGTGVFTGTNYWVEMAVRTSGGGSFATLVPRQQLSPAPYALSLVSPQANALCPPGAVIAYAGTNPPSGWLFCNGTNVSRTTYAALFAAIGTAYGAGDGSTFTLPDMRGRAGIGAGQGTGLSARPLGQTVGAETHINTISEMANHAHTGHTTAVDSTPGTDAARDHANVGTIDGYTYTKYASVANFFLAHTHGITPEGDGAPYNIMQPSLVLNYIIKY